MQLRNTANSYGIISKSLHWIIALLIIAAWLVGYFGDDVTNTDLKSNLIGLHKSVGMLILMLVVIRLSWRAYDGAPEPTGINLIMATAAKMIHYLLYVFMFIQPLSGWAMSSAAGYNPTFFGLFTFPGLVPKNPDLATIFFGIHNTCAMLFLILFVLHVGGALFHHFIIKDNTLRRMLNG